jgi:acylphosphatase
MTSETRYAVRRMTARVSGEVQGVGYRFFARQRAQALGLVGYAQNLADGAALVVAEGSRELLEQLLTQLRRGPISARVAEAQVEWSDATGEFSRFGIR